MNSHIERVDVQRITREEYDATKIEARSHSYVVQVPNTPNFQPLKWKIFLFVTLLEK